MALGDVTFPLALFTFRGAMGSDRYENQIDPREGGPENSSTKQDSL
jgi:hypothetical protein